MRCVNCCNLICNIHTARVEIVVVNTFRNKLLLDRLTSKYMRKLESVCRQLTLLLVDIPLERVFWTYLIHS